MKNIPDKYLNTLFLLNSNNPYLHYNIGQLAVNFGYQPWSRYECQIESIIEKNAHISIYLSLSSFIIINDNILKAYLSTKNQTILHTYNNLRRYSPCELCSYKELIDIIYQIGK